MKYLSRASENVHYLLNREMEPRLYVKPGETVKVECVRADANYLNDKNPVFKDRAEVLELRSNPVTGPIFIEGAAPGDWLSVDILDIELGDDGTQGYYTYVPGQGIFFNPFSPWDYPGQTEFCDVTKELLELNFANRTVLTKKEPFIGTIATAPREDVIAAYYSSKEWLGNVDCQQIRKGSSVVIPVNVDGALLSLGDLHAKQGAGEMLGCAIESAGAVTMRINVLKKGSAGYFGWPQVNRPEFIVKDADVDKQTVSKALEGMGNSMIVAVVEDIVKVHIHTKHPGDALNMAQTWGTLHDIKIENMRDQHENRLFTAEDIQPVKHGVGVLTVAAGDGIAKIMHEMGAAEIISGGQSMNPPVEEFVNAIENGTCEQYIILPNNKNIVLAAEQVRKLLGNSKVAYVPTTNMAQGLSALLHFDATRSMDENTVIMTKEAKETASGSITVAVRDSVVNGIAIHEGDYLGILNDKIVCNGSSMEEVLQKMLTDGDYELISLYYGTDVTEEQAEKLAAEVEELNDEWEVETFYGGQPLYPILLAME